MPKFPLIRPHKRCWLIKTAGRWPWKLESAKECVTTHLPNQLALKMDGAGAGHLYSAVSKLVVSGPVNSRPLALTCKRVAAVGVEGLGREPSWSFRWCRSWW